MKETIEKNNWYLDEFGDYVFITNFINDRHLSTLGGCCWLSTLYKKNPTRTVTETLIRKASQLEHEFYNLNEYLYTNLI